MTDMKPQDFVAEFAQCILNRPVLFEKGWLDALLAIRSGNENAESFFDFLFGGEKKTTYANRDGVAVIDISGPLMKESSYMTSYAGIHKQVGAAMEDDEVRSVLLNIDSGGGVVSGAFELSAFLRESGKYKPLHAMANDDAYSAAYAIASAASHVTVTPTGGVGSIGVIATHVEQSKAEEQHGFTYTTIFSGARKNDFSVHEPLSDHARGELQTRVDTLRDMFAERVALNRNMEVSSVLKTEAGTFHGQSSLDIGLADAIGDFDAAIAAASEAGGVSGSTVAVAASVTTGELAMSDSDKTTATVTETAEVIDLEAERKKVTDLANVHTAARNNEVIELCALAGVPNDALAFISEGTSIKDVRKALLERRHEESAEHISSLEPENATQNEHDAKALVNEMTRRLKAQGITPEVR